MTATIQLDFVGGLVTLQDLGRNSSRRMGVPPGGAADRVSHQIANLLLCNPADAATLEIAGGRFSAMVVQAGWFVTYGAGGRLNLDHHARENGQPHFARAGTRLEIIPAEQGAWTYLAVSGGWEAPLVLQSRSTCLAAGFGGQDGRALQKGDRLKARSPEIVFSSAPTWFFPPLPFRPETPIRVLPGAECHWWSDQQLQHFFSSKFKITRQRDRMGIRLESPQAEMLRRAEKHSMLSSPTKPGAIQAPPDGHPIILLADAQTTGGYPRIAQVIEADLWRLAQVPAEKNILFQQVSLAEAQHALDAQQRFLEKLKRSVALHFR